MNKRGRSRLDGQGHASPVGGRLEHVVDYADTHWRILEQLGELRDLGRVEMSSHAPTGATGRSRSFSPRTMCLTLGHEMARTSNSPQQQSGCLAQGATITARWTTQPHSAQMISISSD